MIASVQLGKKRHDRKRFDCGVEALNNYLRMTANQQSAKDNTRTFVLEDEDNPGLVVGYYTLTMTAIDLSLLPDKLRKTHKNAESAGLIARLAVDKRRAKRGFGEWLLIDALDKLLSASENVDFPLVVVDAKEGAIQFYERFGFVPFLDSPSKLYNTMSEIRAALDNILEKSQ